MKNFKRVAVSFLALSLTTALFAGTVSKAADGEVVKEWTKEAITGAQGQSESDKTGHRTMSPGKNASHYVYGLEIKEIDATKDYTFYIDVKFENADIKENGAYLTPDNINVFGIDPKFRETGSTNGDAIADIADSNFTAKDIRKILEDTSTYAPDREGFIRFYCYTSPKPIEQGGNGYGQSPSGKTDIENRFAYSGADDDNNIKVTINKAGIIEGKHAQAFGFEYKKPANTTSSVVIPKSQYEGKEGEKYKGVKAKVIKDNFDPTNVNKVNGVTSTVKGTEKKALPNNDNVTLDNEKKNDEKPAENNDDVGEIGQLTALTLNDEKPAETGDKGLLPIALIMTGAAIAVVVTAKKRKKIK